MLLLLSACAQAPVGDDSVAPSHGDGERGRELYAAHCSVCHGAQGRGDGPAYSSLFPAARDFTSGLFRLVSTENGVPSDDDIVRTLRRGMPGSSMPAWGWLPEQDLYALARHVRSLAVSGLASRMAGDLDHDMPRARAQATAWLTPGEPLPDLVNEPTREEVDAITLEQGKQLYLASCAACHGQDGRGEATPRYNGDGTPNWARDFTAGYLKGGASLQELAHRIRAGLPGTAMPATKLADEDERLALAAYVRSLIPADAQDRLVHRRRELVVTRHAGAVPEDPGHPAWETANVLPITLAPLAWTPAAIFRAELSGLHDGERVALRVRWLDPTGELHVFSEGTPSDGLALQWSEDETPALFGMASEGAPHPIWHWMAIPTGEGAGYPELLAGNPHTIGEPFRGEARIDVPTYRRELGTPEPSDKADSSLARGPGMLTRGAGGKDLQVQPRWHEGYWEVVLVRNLAAESEGELEFEAGGRVQVAVAIWNGSAGDHGGRKSISIWQELELAP